MKLGDTKATIAKRIETQKKRVLAVLENGWSLTAAARKAGISRTQLWQWREADKEFDEACDAAIDAGTDCLEDIATSRVRRQKSDILTMFMLKGRRPEKFRDNQPGDKGTQPVIVNIKRF